MVEESRMKKYGLFRGWIKKMGILLIPFILAGTVYGGDVTSRRETIVDQFLKMPGAEADVWSSAFSQIKKNWQDSFIPMVLETIYLEPEPRFRGPLLANRPHARISWLPARMVRDSSSSPSST